MSESTKFIRGHIYLKASNILFLTIWIPIIVTLIVACLWCLFTYGMVNLAGQDNYKDIKDLRIKISQINDNIGNLSDEIIDIKHKINVNQSNTLNQIMPSCLVGGKTRSIKKP